jgi:hypothetical protein
MDIEAVLRLEPGDEVYWNDPDADPENDCSRYIEIVSVMTYGDIVEIVGTKGDFLECFAHELE